MDPTNYTRPASWDVVDQASFDSFPASDPPGYYSSYASTVAVEPEPASEAAPESRVTAAARTAARTPDRSAA